MFEILVNQMIRLCQQRGCIIFHPTQVRESYLQLVDNLLEAIPVGICTYAVVINLRFKFIEVEAASGKMKQHYSHPSSTIHSRLWFMAVDTEQASVPVACITSQCSLFQC